MLLQDSIGAVQRVHSSLIQNERNRGGLIRSIYVAKPDSTAEFEIEDGPGQLLVTILKEAGDDCFAIQSPSRSKTTKEERLVRLMISPCILIENIEQKLIRINMSAVNCSESELTRMCICNLL